jgi:hypothetical protein
LQQRDALLEQPHGGPVKAGHAGTAPRRPEIIAGTLQWQTMFTSPR